MTSKTYDKLKYMAQVVLPAAATAYATIASICGLPYATQVTGIIAAADTFLGALLGISTKQYREFIEKVSEETMNDIEEKGDDNEHVRN